MNRYFFDVVLKSHSEYDYRGREFSSVEKAAQLAELIALDLEISPQGEWAGSTVSVRDQRGQQLYSREVRAPELAAA
jgi:uncharacterized protein DUF6894